MEEMNQLFELEQINRIKIETQLEQLQMHRMNLEKQVRGCVGECYVVVLIVL